MQEMNFKVLKLSKENMKFSAAHFLIFDATRAERLHGHNYYVQVQLKINMKSSANPGYGIDFGELKNIIKKRLDQWDERVLLPSQQKEMNFKIVDHTLEVSFRERRYAFPRDEVILLPIVNTSVELLSGLLCEDLWVEMRTLGVEGIKVQVEETRGQAAESALGKW